MTTISTVASFIGIPRCATFGPASALHPAAALLTLSWNPARRRASWMEQGRKAGEGVSRRGLLAGGGAATLACAAGAAAPLTAQWPSLAAGYRAPDWFRDSKFGIWAHWGPQCVPEFGDWYGRLMYVQGN